MDTVARDEEGLIVLQTSEGERRARQVLLATGIKDRLPDLPDLYDATQRGVVRWCPICDGYEVQDKRVAIIGADKHAVREAQFLKTYTPRVGVILIDGELDAESRAELERDGVDLVEAPVGAIRLEQDCLVVADGSGEQRFDTCYPALGMSPRTQLAASAGALTDQDGRLQVNDHQMTSVAGLYAAGDMVRGLNQISIAQAEAAIAATDMHNQLRRRARAAA